jgi:diguanylate cyclase (GGDEF)-like protein
MKTLLQSYFVTQKPKERTLLFFFLVAIISSTVMGVINILFISTLSGYILFSYALISSVFTILFMQSHLSCVLSSRLLIAITYLIIIALFLISPLLINATAWLYLFPMASIVLLNKKDAISWNISFIITLIISIYFSLPLMQYTLLEAFILIASLTTLSTLFFYFVITIRHAQSVVKETSQQLTTLNHSLEAKVQERTNTLEELNKKLLDKTQKDALTGLYNRGYLYERLEQEMTRFKRYETPFSIIFLDIDHFKKINDTYGHIAGDSVLKELSALLHSELRTLDIIGRFGGEEFIIILPNTPVAYAHTVAQKLRLEIANSIRIEDHKITSSFGVTQMGKKDDDKTLIARADKALYQAKLSGRDAVMVELYYD